MQVSAIYLLHVADVVRGLGFDTRNLLSDGGLDEHALLVGGAKVGAVDFASLAMRAMALTGDQCLGCALGLQLPATAHGVLGMAALSKASLRDAVEMGVRFLAIATPFVSLSPLVTEPSVDADGQLYCTTTVSETTTLGLLRHFVLESAAVGLLQAGASLLGVPLAKMPVRITFPWAPSPSFERYRDQLPPTSFNAQALTLSAPAAFLDTRLPLHEPRSSTYMEQACHEAMAHFKRSGGVELQVLARLKPSAKGYPQRDEVARAMGLSVRTLLRQLEEQGTTFQALLQISQRLEAEALLRDPLLSMEAIALRLGYQNPANFARAFKRWTQLSPSAWRQREIGSGLPRQPEPSQATRESPSV